MMARRRPLPLFLALAALCVSCGGGVKTISKNGYTALLVFSNEERYVIAVRGEKQRVAGDSDGSELVKIVRPDLGAIWQFRPSSKKILEGKWSATDEIVPGYPLEPRFDPEAYAHRFGATVQQIADSAHGLHPCDRYALDLPSGDRVIVWAARDLERIPVRIEHLKKQTEDEYQPFTDTQLLDIRIGADEKLFEKPEGYMPVKSYEELTGLGREGPGKARVTLNGGIHAACLQRGAPRHLTPTSS